MEGQTSVIVDVGEVVDSGCVFEGGVASLCWSMRWSGVREIEVSGSWCLSHWEGGGAID